MEVKSYTVRSGWGELGRIEIGLRMGDVYVEQIEQLYDQSCVMKI